VDRCAGRAAVRRITVRDDGHVREFAELVSFLKQERVQVFHNHVGATWEGDWGTLAARAAGVPVVVATEHLPCVIERPGERCFKRRVTRLADRVIAVSESVRQTLLQAEIVTPEQAVTIRNGIELSRFDGLRCPPAVKEALASSCDPLIGTVGRMTEQKGHIYLLRAIPKILARHPQVGFVWVGEGPEWSRLASEAQRLGGMDRVWLMGRRSEAGRWLPAFAFTVLPSLFEGLPLAALESMAAGRAVVGARVCGTRDAVSDGETGLLVEPREPEALAEAILRLLDHPEEALRMGRRAHNLAAEEFSVQRMAREHHELYECLLGRRAAAVPGRLSPVGDRAVTAASTLAEPRWASPSAGSAGRISSRGGVS